MVSGEVWPGIEVVSLDGQHFSDVLQTIDDHAGHGSHPELDHLTVVVPNKISESFVGYVVASQDVKGAQNRPWFGSRWFRQGVIVQDDILRRFLGP